MLERWNFVNFRKLCLLFLGILSYAALCYFSARFALTGLGESFSSRKTLALTLFVTFLCASKKSYYLLILPISLFVSLYSPIGFEYGRPDFQAMISLYATDLAESLEFLSLISFSSYLKALAIVFFPYFAYRLAKLVALKPWRNKTYVCLAIGTLVILLKPTDFVTHSLSAMNDAEKSLIELEKYVNKSSWERSISSAKNKDFILVIGESARKDYFHVYGYPVPNTPFLDKVPSVVVNGLKGGGRCRPLILV